MHVRLFRTLVVLGLFTSLPAGAQEAAPRRHPVGVDAADHAAAQAATRLGYHILPARLPGSLPRSFGSPPSQTEPDAALPYLRGQAARSESAPALPPGPAAPTVGFFPADLSNPGSGPVLVSTQSHSLYVDIDCAAGQCPGNPELFLADLGASASMHLVDQYVGSSAPNRYTVGPAATISYPFFTQTLGENDIKAIVHAGALAMGAGGEHVYHVFLPQGADTCFDQFPECYSPDHPSTFAFCAYHTAVNFSDIGTVLYTVEPYQAVPGCAVPAGSPNGVLADSTYSTLSHELFETITDPIPGQSWVARNSFQVFGAELADLCQGPYAVLNLNGRLYELQLEYSNTYHACVDQ
jgi:hypothetical protein